MTEDQRMNIIRERVKKLTLRDIPEFPSKAKDRDQWIMAYGPPPGDPGSRVTRLPNGKIVPK